MLWLPSVPCALLRLSLSFLLYQFSASLAAEHMNIATCQYLELQVSVTSLPGKIVSRFKHELWQSSSPL